MSEGPMLYGSLTTSFVSQDGNTSMENNGSLWGVVGSSEASEGLSVIYHYEQGIDITKSGLSSGRLSYIGLEGGFGKLAVGQQVAAYHKHVQSLTGKTWWATHHAATGTRVPSMVTYSASTGPIGFQLDVVMHSDLESADPTKQALGSVKGKSVDQVALGMTVDTGFAKLGLGAISKDYGNAMEDKVGSVKVSGIGVSAPVGGLNVYASWNQIKDDKVAADVRDTKMKKMFAGINGPLGDTGLSFALNMSDIDDDNPMTEDGENPWNAHISKSLGGGATVALEYIDLDKDSKMPADKNQTAVSFSVAF